MLAGSDDNARDERPWRKVCHAHRLIKYNSTVSVHAGPWIVSIPRAQLKSVPVNPPMDIAGYQYVLCYSIHNVF